MLCMLPLTASRSIAYTSGAVSGASALTFSAAFFLRNSAQHELTKLQQKESLSPQETETAHQLTARIKLLTNILYISGITTLLGAGSTALNWPYKKNADDSERSILQRFFSTDIDKTQPSVHPDHPDTSSPTAAEDHKPKLYKPANPRICKIFGFRPPELPLMTDMSREDIEAYPDHRWQIRSYRAIDTIESKMRSTDRTVQQEAMEALCLTPVFPGRSHPTLFISGTLSRVNISTAIRRMRGGTTSYIREFPDITPGLTYSPYHLFLMMWLHFAQGMPISVMKEWWLADPESRAMDRHGIEHASNRICINDTFTVLEALAGAPPERQDELIRHVFGHMLT